MNANSDKDYIDAKTEAVRAGMDGRLSSFEGNVNSRFASFEANVNGRFASLEENVNVRFAETNARIDKLDAKIDNMGADLRKEIAESSARMVQWMVGIFLASMAIFITVMTFVLNNAVPKAAPATPPVIIQLSPQGVTIPPPAAPAAKPLP